MVARVQDGQGIPASPKAAAPGAAEAGEQGFLDATLDLLTDLRVLEIALASAIVLTLLVLFFSLRSSLRKLQGRRLLVKYLDGVQSQSAGDPDSAASLLKEVVEADPENIGARIALGEALAQLGRSAEAHEQHSEAQESFGVSGPGIELAMIEDLRDAGATPEALESIERALDKFPRDAAIARCAFEIRSEAGLYEGALEVGRRIATRESDASLRASLAHVAAQAGIRRLAKKDRDGAERLFREATSFDGANREAASGLELLSGDARSALMPRVVPSLESRGGPAALATPENGAAASLRRQIAVVEAHEGATPAPAAGAAVARDFATILGFFPDARCPQCGAARDPALPACPSCGSEEPPIASEPGLEEALADPVAVIDEIEQNERWFSRLADALRRGDDSVHDALLEGGHRSIVPVLRVARTHAANPMLETLLVKLGQRAPASLIEARDKLNAESKGLLEGGRALIERASGLNSKRSVDDVLAPVFRALGESARTTIEEILGKPTRIADRALRQLVLDWHVGIAELDSFQKLGRRFAPVEIVRRFNETPDDALVPLFEQLPSGPCFLRDAVLADPALDKPRALVRAALRACSANAKAMHRWKELFFSRGPGQRVLGHLVTALAGERRAAAEGLLEAFRHQAIEQVVAAFANPEAREDAAMHAYRRLLEHTGAEASDPLVRCFGSSPGEADDRVIEALAAIGKSAVAKLEAAYRGKVGWLSAIGAKRFLGRHPRACIARAIAAISHRAAAKSLDRLRAWESEAELASLLSELIRSRGEGAFDARGDA